MFNLKFHLLDPVCDGLSRVAAIPILDAAVFESFSYIIKAFIRMASIRQLTTLEETIQIIKASKKSPISFVSTVRAKGVRLVEEAWTQHLLISPKLLELFSRLWTTSKRFFRQRALPIFYRTETRQRYFYSAHKCHINNGIDELQNLDCVQSTNIVKQTQELFAALRFPTSPREFLRTSLLDLQICRSSAQFWFVRTTMLIGSLKFYYFSIWSERQKSKRMWHLFSILKWRLPRVTWTLHWNTLV